MEFNRRDIPGWLRRIDGSQTELNRNGRAQKSILAFGFAIVAVTTYIAHINPASAYEVSVYGATPLIAWIGAAVAMAFALIITVTAATRRILGLSLSLAAAVVMWVLALPVLRGYYFWGFNDSLTHLGWVRALTESAMSPFDIVYPAVHLIAAGLTALGGSTETLAMQLVLLMFALAYVVFVPLLAYQLVPYVRVAAVATLAALLFVPVNFGGFKFMFFPFGMSSFLAPMVLYFLVRHTTAGPSESRPTELFDARAQLLTRSAGLFALASVGVIIIHPQAGFNLFVLLVGMMIAKGLFATRWKSVDDTDLRPISGLTTVYAVIFLAWSLQFAAFYEFLGKLTGSILGVLRDEAGLFQIISQRSDSASSVGASLLEIFWKLFLVDAIFLAAAFGLTWIIAARRLDLPGRSLVPRSLFPDREGETLALSLGLGMVLFLPYAGVHLVGGISAENYFFRHFGFLLVPGTVLGSVGFVMLGDRLAGRWSTLRVKQAGAMLAAVVLVLSMVTVFPSPFVYLPSQHVTAQELNGFETTFEHTGDTPLITVRGNGHRYAESLQITDRLAYGARLSPDRLASPDSPVGDTDMVHFGVSKRFVDSEVRAFRGLRYSESYFDSFSNQVGVNRVVANGGFDLYYTQSSVVAKDTTN